MVEQIPQPPLKKRGVEMLWFIASLSALGSGSAFWFEASVAFGQFRAFQFSSFPIMLSQIFWRPDVVLVVEPPLFCAPQALLVARLSGGKAWLQ